MKKIVIILLPLTALFSCQLQNKKPNQTISPVDKTPTSTNLDTQKVTTADELLASLHKCYQEEVCKTQLDDSFNKWLIENKFISNELSKADESDDASIADELIGNNNDTKQLIIPRVHLSSNLMNNELIKGALNEWLTWKRPQLINTWQYYQFLRQDMLPAFQRYGIDEAFILAIMAQESGGKVHSRSRAGAGGLFQIMPATARRLGLTGNNGAYDLRFNPKKSALAAAKYLNEQLLKYEGDKAKVLAAYNSGETRFARLNKRHKNKSLWKKNFYYELPRETRHYIPVVLAAMMIFQNPDKFNVKLDTLDVKTVQVELPKKSSLSELAVCLGQEQRSEGWFRVLRNLNSGIKADKVIKAHTFVTIPQLLQETFEQNCLSNHELMKLAQSLHKADFKERQGLFKYKIKQGDSLGKIARKFKCTSKKEIARLNHLKAPRYFIRAGKYLKIPECR